MEQRCKKIVQKLKESNKTIAFMESCTGGFLANEITNISGASEVLKVSVVTYSDEYKIKLGVNKKTIEDYTVYSQETAIEMAKKISEFANSDIGVGITGELGNTINKEPKVYYSIYLKETNRLINQTMEVTEKNRKDLKEEIARSVFDDIIKSI